MLVEIEERDRPVKNEMILAKTTMANAPQRPTWPTTQPILRNKMMPRIVKTLGTKTPENMPKRPLDAVGLGLDEVEEDMELMNVVDE